MHRNVYDRLFSFLRMPNRDFDDVRIAKIINCFAMKFEQPQKGGGETKAARKKTQKQTTSSVMATTARKQGAGWGEQANLK